MIAGRAQLYNNNGKIGYFDYPSLVYPQGIQAEQQFAIFQHNANPKTFAPEGESGIAGAVGEAVNVSSALGAEQQRQEIENSKKDYSIQAKGKDYLVSEAQLEERKKSSEKATKEAYNDKYNGKAPYYNTP